MRTATWSALACLVVAAATAGGPQSRPRATPAASAGAPILRDDFTDPTSGWERSHDADWVKDYDAGEYRIANLATSQVTYASLSRPELADVDVAVTARKVAGEDDVRIGLTARTSDTAMIEAAIRPAGQCSLRVVRLGAGARRSRVEFVPCPSVLAGSRPNRLRLVVVGSRAAFLVNGTAAATLDGIDVGPGGLGVFASSTDTVSDVRFDDLEVRKPGAPVSPAAGR